MRLVETQKFSVNVWNREEKCVLSITHSSKRPKPMSCFLHYESMLKKIISSLGLKDFCFRDILVKEESTNKLTFDILNNREIIGHVSINKMN